MLGRFYILYGTYSPNVSITWKITSLDEPSIPAVMAQRSICATLFLVIFQPLVLLESLSCDHRSTSLSEGDPVLLRGKD